MKKLIGIIALAIILNIVFAIFPERLSAQSNDVNFQVFYDQLSPYGQWVDNPDYGYVWIPSAGSDFTPYLTNGYWTLTDDGWTWVSNYEWGWAPFHYGRWDYNDSYNGWYWIPDNQWGPSWVTWRRSEGYYGWAPMRPGISINASFGRSNNVPYNQWNFVRDRDIERNDIGKNFIDRRNNGNIYKGSTVINKTYFDNKRHATYVTGPGREDVQKITGKSIQQVSVHERDKPGESINNNQLQIYRPQIQKNINGHKPAPSSITKVKDVKRISGKEAGKQSQNTMPTKSNLGKAQQPAANIPNKINSRQNIPQQRNTNSPNNNLRKIQQPAVNTVNRTENKNQAKPLQMPNSPKKQIRADRTVQSQNINIPKSNNTSRQPRVNAITPPRQNTISQPKQNSIRQATQNSSVKRPSNNNMQPARSHNVQQPAHSNPTENKREERK
jgi:hypothetical protein